MNIRSIMKMCCIYIGINSSTRSSRARRGNLVAQNARNPFSGRGRELTALPQTHSWWRGRLAPLSNNLTALSPSGPASPVSPLQNCATQYPHLMQAVTPQNLISATTETCVFLSGRRSLFLHSSARFGFWLYLNSSK